MLMHVECVNCMCDCGERLPGMCSWGKGCLVCAVGGKGAWYVQFRERVPGMCSWGKGAWYVQLGEMGHLHFQGSSPPSELKALKQGF